MESKSRCGTIKPSLKKLTEDYMLPKHFEDLCIFSKKHFEDLCTFDKKHFEETQKTSFILLYINQLLLLSE